MAENTLNLDKKAAQCAQEIVQNKAETETLVTKTLGVLQEQGVYACMLYLFSRSSSDKDIAKRIRYGLYDLLNALPAFKEMKFFTENGVEKSPQDVLEIFSDEVCDNLDNLLLVKDVYEQCLIYARFTAKAMKQGE